MYNHLSRWRHLTCGDLFSALCSICLFMFLYVCMLLKSYWSVFLKVSVVLVYSFDKIYCNIQFNLMNVREQEDTFFVCTFYVSFCFMHWEVLSVYTQILLRYFSWNVIVTFPFIGSSSLSRQTTVLVLSPPPLVPPLAAARLLIDLFLFLLQ